MKGFDRMLALLGVLLAVIFLSANLVYLRHTGSGGGSGMLKIETDRIERQLRDGGSADLSDCQVVTGVYTEEDGDIYASENSYLIREVGGRLYRIEYDEGEADGKGLLIMDLCLGAAFVLLFGVLLFVRGRILKPFNRLSALPEELAKGDLSVQLPETKDRYFGRFIWGLNMLRDELAAAEEKESQRIRQEKTQLLSLSHDIKTPLAAIKLYSKALSRGLYTDSERLSEAAAGIEKNADEIERYLGQLIKTSEEDMMSFEVESGEVYMSEAIGAVKGRYAERLELLGTELSIEKHPDCLLSADGERLTEVLQNIFENALKYGDGRRISIRFSDEEDCRLITIANTGCTLPEGELESIFNSFWRGSNSKGKQGSGLGLYICRRLMRAMGGDIFAELKNGEIGITLVCKKA